MMHDSESVSLILALGFLGPKSLSEGLFTPLEGMSRTSGLIRVESAHDDMDRDRVGA
jgi:hypothetical protein